MKHRKLLSMLLALVMVLSLAPSAVFAREPGIYDPFGPIRPIDPDDIPDEYDQPGYYYQPERDNVHVASVKKTWLYADGQEIPADELAALIDQGVIPESVDIFYGLVSSDWSQSAYVNADGAIVHGLLELWDWWNWDTGEWGIPEHVDLTALGPEDIGGWSKQTLSSENDWSIIFTGGNRVVGEQEDPHITPWIYGGDRELMDGFIGYEKVFQLRLNPAVNRWFVPVKEFIPEGFPLVSSSSKLEEMTEIDPIRFAPDLSDYYVSFDEWVDEWVERYGIEVVEEDNWHDAPYEIGEMLWSSSFTMPITNTYSGEKPWKDITVTKTWDDGAASFRPESITVNLLANGETVASKTVTADDDWVCTFESVPVYSEGTEISYTVTEDAVPGYETTVDGFEITNTCTSGTLQIVKKSEGAQTPDGTRFTITGTPEADGVTFETRTVRYADFENGVYTLENVPAGTYTVTENQNDATLAGYELTVSGSGATKTLLRGDTVKFVITNKYERTTEVIPVNPTPTPAPALNTEDHYAYIIGYPDGLVRPNGTITRAEVVTVFFRMLTDASRDAIWSTSNSFTDVQLNEWFNNAISTIENGGIINGYPDGSFNPNGNITRAEFAAMAIRFFQDAKVGPSKFSDTIGHWAEEAIRKAQNEGLIMGYPDGTFHPDQPITRAEAMTIFNRVLKRAPHKDHLVANMIQWPDNMNKSVWYYADVQEATNSHTYTMSDTTTSAHEIWQKLLPVRDWEAFEKAWSTAHSASNPGEVVNN